MNVEEKIAAVRASNCVHNPTYRRKLRKLYAKCPEAAKILEIEVKSGRIHTHTVCVPYYKAAPYNISHTKIFSRAKYNRVI